MVLVVQGRKEKKQETGRVIYTQPLAVPCGEKKEKNNIKKYKTEEASFPPPFALQICSRELEKTGGVKEKVDESLHMTHCCAL